VSRLHVDFGKRSWAENCVVISLLLLSASCGPSPKAPLLRDEPIYENRQAGFRFQVPEGWAQVAKGDLPGDAAQERLLVEYQALATEQPAALQVTAIDLSPSANLEKYLSGPSFAETWRPTAKPETFQVNRVEAMRFTFESKVKQENRGREVVAFRRKDRVYLFTSVFALKDTKAREQIRAATKSIIWK